MDESRRPPVSAGIGWALLAGLFLVANAAPTEPQTVTASAACSLHNNLYTCDKASFERVLANAKTVAIETGPTDAVAQQRLRHLISAIGKSVVAKGQHADITLLLVPVDPAGVQYNTNSAQLATLRVFAAQPSQTGRGALVWAENYDGDVDLQWPAIVNQLIARFRSEFGIKG